MLLINFQKLLVVSRYPGSDAERQLLVAPPPSPMPTIEETLLVGQMWNDVERTVADAFRLLNPVYHTLLSSVRPRSDIQRINMGKYRLHRIPSHFVATDTLGR